MKFLAIISLCFVLIFFDCSSNKSKTSKKQSSQESKTDEKMESKESQVEKNMSEFLSYENVTDGIEYKFKAEMKKAGNYNGIEHKNDFVEIEYELNNTSEKDYIVFNKGHFGTNSYKVYVEPNKDGTVEISQKAFEEPADRRCPQRFVAISPLASMLKSNGKMTKKVQVEIPLETRTPYDDCEPKPELPKQIKQLKFCVGVLEADSSELKLSDDGRVSGMNSMKEQKLLCSDSVSMK